MDDIKRAIYLEVLNELKKPNKDVFICKELYFALRDIYGIVGSGGGIDAICLIEEFFPEFYDLFDGYAYGTNSRWETEKNKTWFSYTNRQARITLINFLLSNR